MTTQFEFHLKGADAPAGQLDANHLLAIVRSLNDIALNIGRLETDAERVGRPPRRTREVARLLIGMIPGSTTIVARRAGPGDALFDFDLEEERAFDESYSSLIESIGLDQRPPGVTDSLARSAAELITGLQAAAPEVEFKVDGQDRSHFRTQALHRETWQVTPEPGPEPVTFVGRLFAVNLNSHTLQVQDDVANTVALPAVVNDVEASHLIGTHVLVTGAPQHGAQGRLTHIHDATIVAAPDPLAGMGVPETVSLEEILASAPGVQPGGIEGLTDAEADAFYDAMGL